MALEEITTEVDIQNPEKKKGKKPLASMKKKYVKGVEVMDTELRENVPVKQVKKESQDFADAMERARKMTASEIAAKDKPKIKVMKKLGKAAGKAAADLAPMIPSEPLPHQNQKFTIRKAHDYDGEMKKAMPEAYKKTGKDLEEIGLKMAEKYKSKFTPAENSERGFDLKETALDRLKEKSKLEMLKKKKN